MSTTSKIQIKHCDKNTLNNCKSNLKIYSKTMINDYEQIDDKTIAIILKDKFGAKKAKTLIDKDDLERVINNGYTWCYMKGNGEPYVCANVNKKRVYLHRFIMDTPDEMVVDHKNHNTLDNRKSNLVNATISQNQQNRKGTRKGSKSGVRCVSWDSGNQDWIVNIKGQYYGRFKDKLEAISLAEKLIKELMPYLDTIK